jgi:hypothetical protein
MKPIMDEERPRFLADEGFNMDVTTGLRRAYPENELGCHNNEIES